MHEIQMRENARSNVYLDKQIENQDNNTSHFEERTVNNTKNTDLVQENNLLRNNNEVKDLSILQTSVKKHRVRKRIEMLDSDSEDDMSDKNIDEQNDTLNVSQNSDLSSFLETEKINETTTSKPRKRITVLESDSEDEDEALNQASTQPEGVKSDFDSEDHDSKLLRNITNSKKSKKKINFNSDSDENDIVTPLKSFNTDIQPIYTTDSKGELISETPDFKSTKWAALCDSDSSEPEDNGDPETVDREQKSDNEKNYNSEDEIIKPIKYKKKKKSKNENEMTPNEAAKQREEIRSESQRMVRESFISLPYHRPKSFTLKEFLAKRPKFASSVPTATRTPPSVAIKMSVQQLEIISKNLEERHKEVKEFYKSDSEPDELDDKDDPDFNPEPANNEDSNGSTKNTNADPELNLTSTNNEDGGESTKSSNVDSEFNPESTNNEDGHGSTKSSNVDSEFNPESTNNEAGHGSTKSSNVDSEFNPEFTNNDDEHGSTRSSNVDSEFNPESTNNEDGHGSTKSSNVDSELNPESTNNEDGHGSTKSSNVDTELKGSELEKITERENIEDIKDHKENLDELEENKDKSEEIINAENNINKINIISEYIIITSMTSNNNELIEADKINENCNKINKIHNTDIEERVTSPMDYEFNLDDVEENSEKIIQENKHHQEELDEAIAEKNTAGISKHVPFEFGDLDKEIENFGNPEKPKTKLELLKERLSNFKPRLSGGRNNIVDLDNVARPNEVTKLMQRFAQHTAKKVHHKENKVKLNIVSVENGGEIHKETVAVNVEDDEDLVIEEKPGVRLQKLRNELQSQIAQRKSEIWQQKLIVKENTDNETDPYDGEKSECGAADDPLLDDEEEEEMSESSEEEEDYGIEDDKPKKKSAFLDEEAEESDINEDAEEPDDNEEDEELDADDEHNEGEDETKDDKNNDFEEESTENKENGNSEVDHDDDDDKEVPFKKPLKRIVKGFTEDSDEDEDIGLPGETIRKIAEKLNKSTEDTYSTQDDYIPPYQNQNYKTPIKSCPLRSNSGSTFLTPVSYITGIQNLTNSASKLINVPSPLKEADWQSKLQRKLQADSIITNSQASAMRELCSEKFPESQDISQSTDKNLTSCVQFTSSTPPTTQDILNVCSGTFDEQSSIIAPSLPPSTQDILNMCSGNFTGISQVSQINPTNTETHQLNPITEMKSLDKEDDMIISQLLNEDEMEAFKKKFDSPILTHSQKVMEEAEEVAGGGIIDSDEDEDDVLEVKKKKRNQKKLTFSDDSSNGEEENEEEIDLHDNIEEEDEEDIPVDEIGYDSEENEVHYKKETDNVKMTDFFEDEAELSESDWGSADEDEKDLDTLDFELGDKEKFDEKQLKTDLERIHMRRMLDDDTREVKLLQEMLLDDGELHGTGRERQFRWKNIDSTFPDDNGDAKQTSDDENHFEDNESEEQWRRRRHEREMFLKEKNSQEMGDEELLSGSELLKIGHQVIQRSLSNTPGNESIEKPNNNSSPALKRSFSILHKRGSFLNRGDQVLERLVEYNKTTLSEGIVTGKAAKNSKNFLFQTVAQESVITTSFLNLKRKSEDGTPKIIKKLRLSDNLSPANRKKKPDKKIRAKLFGIS